MGLGAGDGDALRVHGHRQDGVALGKGVGHQRHHGCHVDFQGVDTQVGLPGVSGKPLGQGFQARAQGRDVFQWVLGVAGRQRRQALCHVGRDQPFFEQCRQQRVQFQSMINGHEAFPGRRDPRLVSRQRSSSRCVLQIFTGLPPPAPGAARHRQAKPRACTR
jgi:hypothetical protein